MQRVIVPPVSSWRVLGKRFQIGIPVLFGIEVLLVWTAISSSRDNLPPTLIMMCEVGIPLIIAVLVAFDRLHRRLAFEVTPSVFRKLSVELFGCQTIEWARADVLGVTLNSVNKKLILHTAGFNAVDIFLGPDAAANQRIADALQKAMTTIPADSSELSPGGPDGLKQSRTRSVLLIIAAILAVAGLIATCFFPSGLCVFLIPAAIAAGVAMGRQTQKEYWM